MRTLKYLILLIALVCANTTVWAEDFNVSTDAELRDAIQNDGANITVTANIDLSNSTLSIESGKTITIDLNGHTLDRKLTQRGEGGGQVITVRSGATLNLSNGTLKGGWGGNAGGLVNENGTVNLTDVNITGCTGDDKGGGICNFGTLTMTGGSITGNTSFDKDDPTGGGGMFNAEGATATLTGVTITGNQAKSKGGGGICNYGTLTLDGCTITGNSCKMNGGGIYNYSTATLNMQGKNTITDNIGKEGLTHNVFLKENAVITVTSALTDSKIGVTLEDETGTFTSGYKENNSDIDPATIFSPDLNSVMAISLVDNEAQLTKALPDGAIYYIERSWDDASNAVKTEIKILKKGDYIVLDGSDDDLIISQGTFVVKGDVSYDHIYTVDGGKHNIILCDDAKLSTDFLRVEDDNEVYIYGQQNNTGKLVITDELLAHHAGIGSDKNKTVGTIVIHGGDINTKGSLASAGIGGGEYSAGGTVTIYGGKVYAEGNTIPSGSTSEECVGSAGIGGGFAGNGGDLTVYGGYVEAQGSFHDGGAGIGSGRGTSDKDKPKVYGGNVTIYGGTVIAHGSYDGGAGIGGGADGNGATVTIHGGIVKAWGADNGAGIGTGHNGGYDGAYIDFTGKLTVTGGEVYAYGYSNTKEGEEGGAGIGGGRDANGSEVIITGGYVYAEGGSFCAGIGSGCEALFSGGVQGGSLTVTGGRVEAYGGEDAAGIGGGEDADGGTITISGGYVYAKGSYGGAGIGGGEGGDGGNVTITGGTVHASAGSGDTGNRAIGPGSGSEANGSLTIGDEMMVYSERKAAAVERHDMCWYRTDVHVEPCTHQGGTCAIIDGSSHSVNGCIYCTASNQEHEFGSYGECPDCHLVSLANNADNGDNLDYWNAEEKSVVLSDRTLFKDGSWNTLCLPFALDNFEGTPLEGAEVRTVESASLNNTTLTLNFASASAIEAGKPYIVRWNSGDDLSNPVFFNALIDKDERPLVFDDVVTFQGTYSPFAFGAQDKSKLYMGSENKLYYPKKNMTIKSFRAFFDLGENSGEAKEITDFVLNFGDSTTEILNSQLSTVNSNDSWYSIDGRKLNGKPTQKGVYIHKGKKIVK